MNHNLDSVDLELHHFRLCELVSVCSYNNNEAKQFKFDLGIKSVVFPVSSYVLIKYGSPELMTNKDVIKAYTPINYEELRQSGILTLLIKCHPDSYMESINKRAN